MTYKTIEAVAEALSIALAERGRATEELATIAIAAYQQAVASEAVGRRWKWKDSDTWEEADLYLPGDVDTDALKNIIVEPLFAAPPATPAGWKLVPIEPTVAMLDAYWNRAGESKEMRPRTHHSAKAYYAAMLAAAPTPENQP